MNNMFCLLVQWKPCKLNVLICKIFIAFQTLCIQIQIKKENSSFKPDGRESISRDLTEVYKFSIETTAWSSDKIKYTN